METAQIQRPAPALEVQQHPDMPDLSEAAQIPQTIDLREVELMEASTPPEAAQIPTIDLRSPAAIESLNATPESPSLTRRQQIGRAVLMRAGVEIVGAGVDVALMAGGSSGIGLLRSVVNREVAATVPEATFLEKMGHSSDHETEDQKRYRVLRKMGAIALGVGAAVAAQKVGTGIVEHVAANLNHGLGHYAVPLTSKVGVAAGINTVRNRLSSRSIA